MSEHDVFVYASYGLGALILIVLILWLWIDRNITMKELARLEEMGVRRRSQTPDNQA